MACIQLKFRDLCHMIWDHDGNKNTSKFDLLMSKLKSKYSFSFNVEKNVSEILKKDFFS